MTFTPVDPTKAEVRVTQDGDELGFDFYIPRGATGAAGPFANNLVATTTNLNDLTTPGVYSFSTGTDAAASALRNLPFHEAGSVIVTKSNLDAAVTIQMVTTNTKNIYVRRLLSGSWNSWRSYAHTRVSQTAGRAIYQWDDLNNREQLVYGDTGWRDISADLLNGATGTVFIRRVGSLVTLRVGSLKLPSTNINDPWYQCTAGFITPLAYLSAREDVNTGQFTNIAFAGSVFLRNGTTLAPNNTTHRFSGSVTTMTDNAWPTTLPGVASGSIPNL